MTPTLGYRLEACELNIPDAERNLLQTYPAFAVMDNDLAVGYVWRDASAWCWKTYTGVRFGREAQRRAAIAKLVEHAS